MLFNVETKQLAKTQTPFYNTSTSSFNIYHYQSTTWYLNSKEKNKEKLWQIQPIFHRIPLDSHNQHSISISGLRKYLEMKVKGIRSAVATTVSSSRKKPQKKIALNQRLMLKNQKSTTRTSNQAFKPPDSNHLSPDKLETISGIRN